MREVTCFCGRSVPFGRTCPECGENLQAVRNFLHSAVKVVLGMSTYWWATLFSLDLDFENKTSSLEDVQFLVRRTELVWKDMARVMAPGYKTIELAKMQASFLRGWEEIHSTW